tara:strand:+ start:163 stop:1986 length:1824 start_codon:yes stop_codon:yes gene_type:complete
MSIIETLTEGIVNRDMKKEGSALLSKWGKTGLLEGLQSEHEKAGMARLLENQAKELLREANTMSSNDVEGFAAVAFPIVRRVFAGLIANQLVSVQPMSLPSGLIFFLDFTYGANINNGSSATRFGNEVDASIYGTDKVGKGVAEGVSLLGSDKADLSGPGRGGMTGYAFASPTGSNSAEFGTGGAAVGMHVATFHLDGTVSDVNKKYIKYDADLLTLGSTDDKVVMVFELVESLHDQADLDNLSAFDIDATALLSEVQGQASGSPTGAKVIRRLTSLVKSADSACSADAIRYIIIMDGILQATEDSTAAALSAGLAIGKVTYPLKDTAASSVNSAGALTAFDLPMEGISEIPEIDIKVDSIAITAQTKKLKAKWTPELGQDLNAYHNLDAEVELTSILSEQIALEIDREILADLVNGATAGTQYWSRSPGLFVNKETGLELGANSAAPDFTGTVSEWYETLIETINDVSAQIHRKTLRGGANFVIVSPEVANILEFTSGFRANVTADADKGEIGAVKVGSLSRKFDVIVDPYFPRNVILVGRKGNSFLESGYVYAPYVPLQTTPTIFGVEDFVPRKGVMTRYAKKMVRPDMYGLVVVRDLLGGEYSS